jgi:hypothetical protein
VKEHNNNNNNNNEKSPDVDGPPPVVVRLTARRRRLEATPKPCAACAVAVQTADTIRIEYLTMNPVAGARGAPA